ncbi:hypothetical protein T484DRAFT_2784363 [Baffinella frigidus]|nr:hypothetical protein T484DRAFT_2784363 [Cryptophyta sp. CCMP2293]
MASSILPGKFGQGAVSVTLSKEEWDAFEDSAERMGKALVGSLKSILDEVHLVLDHNTAGSARPVGQKSPVPPSPENGAQREVDAAAWIAAKRKTDYEDFIVKMRDPRAAPLRNALQAFCKQFLEGVRHDPETARDLVQEQMEHLETNMVDHVLWAHLDEDAQEAAFDSLERYLTSRLHTRIFAPGIDARQHDADLRMRIAKLQFITPDHLDIPALHRNPEAPTPDPLHLTPNP